ncbi:DUF554 domain-containing protein [Intestinimonas massiliensis (ex Afouda et al. 2020)]|uniref:DUF554 domain-containing protein n=1 Tax=Intestinimonas massiliensis (ex Afouda et al. 2020) TaxID=1673721 RepID=UPI0013EF2A0F|nr:DUF554 domain-containing protein [Intestinimonas massiliensis (ex Afouda et al. 2020)]
MPVGILIDSTATLVGGILGSFLGDRFPPKIAKTLSYVFAISATAIGITMIVSVSQLSAVILSLILGACLGELFSLNRRISALSGRLNLFFQNRFSCRSMDTTEFINIIIMFSISGYGIFGALNEGFSGDHSSLIVKAILDFFTILCFSATFGKILICTFVPQFFVYISLYLLASLVMPLADATVMGDLSACAGIITMAIGLNLLFKKNIPTVSMLPALVLIIPISRLWAFLL